MKKILATLVITLVASATLNAAPMISVVEAGPNSDGNDVYHLVLDTDGVDIKGFDLIATDIISITEVVVPGFGTFPVTAVWNNSQANLGMRDSYVNFHSDDVLPANSSEADGVLEAHAGGADGSVLVDANSTDFLFAQLVVAPGTQAAYEGTVTDGVNEPVPFSGVVPEPASLALLGIGGLALIRRRRAA